MALPAKTKRRQIPDERRGEMLGSMTEILKGYIAGDHFELQIHRLTCDEMGISALYDPNNINEDDPVESELQDAYYNIYTLFQIKILAQAIQELS